MLFVSGQVGKHPETGIIPENVKEQTIRVMENLKGILADAGMNFENVVKTTIFLKNLNDFATVNEIYGSILQDLTQQEKQWRSLDFH